jgi:hypothetical protein
MYLATPPSHRTMLAASQERMEDSRIHVFSQTRTRSHVSVQEFQNFTQIVFMLFVQFILRSSKTIYAYINF